VSLLNFILDLAGLLLWLSWRSLPHDPLARPTPATLVGTVRRAEPSRWRRWHFLLVLAGLLFLRGLFYWQIGPALNWTPRMNLGFVVPAFPTTAPSPLASVLFSVLSFARTWIVFHFWLLALATINGRSAETSPCHKFILLQLGWVGRWPRGLQALLPVVFTALFWTTLHPLLVRAGVVNQVSSVWLLLEQGALLGAELYFTLKILIPLFLFFHLVASYVYLGNSPIWDYVSATSSRVLVPLKGLPLRAGPVDFAPLVGMVLVLLLLHLFPNVLLTQLDRRDLTLWPQ
jgi:uncharacterized protein YggT (Ycf19 family)